MDKMLKPTGFGMYVITAVFFSLILKGTSTFSFKNADKWGEKYPGCNGKMQSPILFNSKDFTPYRCNQDWPSMLLEYLREKPTSMTLKNSGTAVELRGTWPGEPPFITNGILQSGHYEFEKIIFTWSQVDKQGSPHRMIIRNIPTGFDMEMHLIFYNKKYKTFDKAQYQKDGLANVAMWFNVNDKAVSKLKLSKNDLKKVQSLNATAKVSPFPLSDFISTPVPQYMHYNGSKGIPPCPESVAWFIFPNVLPITKSQLESFRKVQLAEGDTENVRPIQPLNGRRIILALV